MTKLKPARRIVDKSVRASRLDPKLVGLALGAEERTTLSKVRRTALKSLLGTLIIMRQDAVSEVGSWWGAEYTNQANRQRGVVEGLDMAIALVKRRAKR